MKQKLVLTGKIILCFLIIVVAVMGMYFSSYYEASKNAQNALESTSAVKVEKMSAIKYAFIPTGEIKAGVIFYPGAKVEFTAYAPLMQELAKQGILCVLCHMPENFAFFNSNAASGVQEKYPQVKSWYLAGHSLGGVVASSYLSKHIDEYDGMIFLASYTTKDFSKTNLKCLSIYGDKDGVINMDNYTKNKSLLPVGTKEVVLEGGCHGFFGDYGNQKGDGVPTITREAQLNATALAIKELIG